MCEEIELHRHDETPWGFRLTGGHDFGIPLTVVRVTGGSLAEEAGMCVGDMIIEINGDGTAQITHSEAQQCILEAGNHITLSILRGSPVPAVTPTRGLHTPSVVDRATSSVGSLTEYETMHSGAFRDNVVSAVSESYESGHEMTEEEIAEKLLESAEVIENNGKNVIGVNFKRFVPKCDFIKNSLVFQTLQEEQIFDQKSEQDQLKKCPTKRFSTFLTTPNRPKIKPPEKKKPEEPKEVQVKESVEDKQNEEENIKTESCKQVCTSCKCKLKDIEDFVGSTDAVTVEKESIQVIEDQDENNMENLSEEKNEEKVEPKETDPLEEVENKSIAEVSIIEETEIVHGSEEIHEAKKEPANEFEKNIADIQNQIAAIRELPQQIQNHITLLEKRLSDLLTHRVPSAEETTETGGEKVSDEDGRREEGTLAGSEVIEDDSRGDPCDDDVFEAAADDGTADEDARQTESDENADGEVGSGQRAEETSCSRPMYPLTPLPRPIVLPGGRKWRGPKDAYNEKFIAETLISQAEVLVGSTLGVNFRKYEPPKFDMSNSAVYKLVHNIEAKNTGGIENRPEIVAAEEDFYYHKPIDARQFYLATLPQPSIVPDFEKDNQYEH